MYYFFPWISLAVVVIFVIVCSSYFVISSSQSHNCGRQQIFVHHNNHRFSSGLVPFRLSSHPIVIYNNTTSRSFVTQRCCVAASLCLCVFFSFPLRNLPETAFWQRFSLSQDYKSQTDCCGSFVVSFYNCFQLATHTANLTHEVIQLVRCRSGCSHRVSPSSRG